MSLKFGLHLLCCFCFRWPISVNDKPLDEGHSQEELLRPSLTLCLARAPKNLSHTLPKKLECFQDSDALKLGGKRDWLVATQTPKRSQVPSLLKKDHVKPSWK